MNKYIKKLTLVSVLALSSIGLVACGSQAGTGGNSEPVIIYSNADDEAIDVIEQTLNENGFENQYEIQTFGTSELGGKLTAEGADIEADLVTMSSFYLDSAQNKHDMFAPLEWDVTTIAEFPDFYAPLTVQEGAILVNDEMIAAEGLEKPASIADLADAKYANKVSVVNIDSSSTAWLMIQALISEYGEEKATEILAGIYRNAGNYIEDSGSGPLNKVISGEVPLGYGLRHQILAEQENGIPVSLIDPAEGTFSLTESVAVVDKVDSAQQQLAQEMSQVIIEEGRAGIQQYYPTALYEGEETNSQFAAANPQQFEAPLTAELLEKHQEISDKAKALAK